VVDNIESFAVVGQTNLPELAALVEKAYGQLARTFASGLPELKMGNVDLAGFDRWARKMDEIKARGDQLTKELIAQHKQQVDAQTKAGVSPGQQRFNYDIAGLQGASQRQMLEHIQRTSYQMAAEATATLRNSGSAIVKGLHFDTIIGEYLGTTFSSLRDMTKAQLQGLARELQVPGFSKMTKDQLIPQVQTFLGSGGARTPLDEMYNARIALTGVGTITKGSGEDNQEIVPDPRTERYKRQLEKEIEGIRLSGEVSRMTIARDAKTGMEQGLPFKIGRYNALYDPSRDRIIDKYSTASPTSELTTERERQLRDALAGEVAAVEGATKAADLLRDAQKAAADSLKRAQDKANQIQNDPTYKPIRRNVWIDSTSANQDVYQIGRQGEAIFLDPNDPVMRAKRAEELRTYQRGLDTQRRRDLISSIVRQSPEGNNYTFAEMSQTSAMEKLYAKALEQNIASGPAGDLVRAARTQDPGNPVRLRDLYSTQESADAMHKVEMDARAEHAKRIKAAADIQEKLNKEAQAEGVMVTKAQAEYARAMAEASREANKLALEESRLANLIEARHGAFLVSQDTVSPSGRKIPQGMYAMNGAPMSQFDQAQWNQRYGQRTFFGSLLGGMTGSGFGSHSAGIDPNWLGNLGTAAGNVLKYGSLYNVLFGISAVMRDVLEQAKNMSDSMRDLRIAMGGTNDVGVEFINTLSNISKYAGSNVGEAMDSAARGVRMFAQDLADVSEVERVGSTVASVATQISLITSKTLPDATGDVTAIGSAFGLTADSLQSVVDAISSAKNRLGGDPQQVSQGLANIAQTANEAGFNLREAAAAVSIVQGRTDQSGQSVATRLSRVFSILQGTTGRGVIARINQQMGLTGDQAIDPSASVRDQIARIAAAYQQASPELRKITLAQLGGPSNSRELAALFNNYQAIFDPNMLDKAFKPGAGMDEFKQKSEDLVGTLRMMQGTVNNIATGLAQSKIFAPFAITLKVVEPLLTALDRMLQIFNQLMGLLDRLPGSPNGIGGYSGILMVAVEMRLLIKAFSTLGGLAPFKAFGSQMLQGTRFQSALTAADTARKAAVDEGTAKQASADQARVTATNEATAALSRAATLHAEAVILAGEEIAVAGASAAAATRAGGAAGLAGSAISAASNVASKVGTGVSAAAGAGRIAMGALGGGPGIAILLGTAAYMLADGVRTALQEQTDTRSAATALVSDSAKTGNMKDLPASLRTLAATLEEQQGGPSGIITSSRRGSIVQEINAQADAWEQWSLKVGKERQILALANAIAAFGDVTTLTAESIGARMQEMETNGASAAVQLAAVNGLLLSLGKPRSETLTPEEAILAALQGSTAAAQAADKQAREAAGLSPTVNPLDRPGINPAQPLGIPPVVGPAPGPVAPAGGGEVSPTGFQDLLTSLVQDPAMQGKILTNLQEYFGLGRPLTKAELERVKKIMLANLLRLLPKGTDLKAARAGATPLVDEIVAGLFTAGGGKQVIGTEAAIALGSLQQSLLSGTLSSSTSTKARIAAIKRTLEGAKSNLANAAPGSDFSQLQVNVQAIEKQLVDEQAKQIEERARARASRTDSQKEQKAILDRAFAKIAGKAVESGSADAIVEALNRGNKEQVDQAIADAKAVMKAKRARYDTLLAMGLSLDAVVAAVGDVPAMEKALAEALGRVVYKQNGEFDPQASQMSIAQARRLAGAARDGGQMAQASAQLAGATEDLRKETKGTVEYYQRLASLYQAQSAMRDAVLAYRDTQNRLSIDMTDPVSAARADLLNARRKLASDRAAGAGVDVIAQDRLNVRQARNAAESAAFSQNLQDMQYKDQMGQISHAAYIRYLRREHDRFAAMKDRTRQQEEQMRQIDQALKSATDSMNSQWNLGDIKVPTPYEARRYVQGQMQAASLAAGNAAGQTVQISIDGTDVAMVQRVMATYLGPVALSTAGTTKNK